MSTWSPPGLPASWARSAHPAFVGRARELAQLDAAWSAAAAGARQVVLLGGEPGAGKTRLAAEAAVRCAGAGAAVLVGTCIAEFGPAYQPLVEPLRALADGVTGGGILVPARPAVLEHLLVLTHHGTPLRTSCGRDSQHEVLDAAVQVLLAATAARPVLLLLDDVHWTAESGLDLLVHLVERTPDARLLVLATHRTTAPARTPALMRALARLARVDGVQRLDLLGLSQGEVAQYLSEEARVDADHARAAAEPLHARSGGNPFFLRELWRDLLARGGLSALDRSTFDAPASVRDMVESRLDALDPVCRELVELAAVMGQDFDDATLLAAADGPVREVLEALDRAVAAAFVHPVPGGGRFHHALVRRSVLDVTSPSRVLRWHARIAEALEQGSPSAPLRVQRMAHHYASAAALGHADTAVHWLEEAAGQASHARAHRDAGAMLLRAAALCSQQQRRDALLVAAAHSLLLGDDFGRARTLAEPVAASAGDPAVALQAAITYELASWRPGRSGRRAAQLLQGALQRLPEDPLDPAQVRARAGLGRALAFSGAREEAALVADAAIAAARTSGDAALLAQALEPSLQHHLRPEDAPVRLARAGELTALARRTGHADQLAAAAFYRGTISYLRGDADGLSAAHRDLQGAAASSGQGFWAYIAGCMDYGVSYARGDLAAAERSCRRLLALGKAFGEDDVEGPCAVQTYMVRRETGRLEQVRGLVTGEEPSDDHWLPGLLALYSELRLLEPTRRVLWTLLDGRLSDYQHSAEWPGVLAFLAEAVVVLGDAEAAGRLRPLLAEYEGSNLVAGPFVALFGSADQYLAGLDELVGAGDPEASFGAAVATARRTGASLHEAQALAGLAAYRRRHPQPGASPDAPEAQARALAERLGLVRVLRALPAAAPPRPATPTAPAAAGCEGCGLTPREEEVLALLGEGLTNRLIARRLVVTEHTAANHVRSILQKTGSANRTQAALLARRRLPP